MVDTCLCSQKEKQVSSNYATATENLFRITQCLAYWYDIQISQIWHENINIIFSGNITPQKNEPPPGKDRKGTTYDVGSKTPVAQQDSIMSKRNIISLYFLNMYFKKHTCIYNVN